MKKFSTVMFNIAISVLIMGICLFAGFVLRKASTSDSLFISVFVLGSFMTALFTTEYIYGIAFSLVSVIAVNFAFTFPYFQLNFTIPENLLSAIIMMIVACMTSTLTTKLKKQEFIKAQGEKEKMRADLLRAISHDLRTPLTTIYGASSAILENGDSLTDAQKQKML